MFYFAVVIVIFETGPLYVDRPGCSEIHYVEETGLKLTLCPKAEKACASTPNCKKEYLNMWIGMYILTCRVNKRV